MFLQHFFESPHATLVLGSLERSFSISDEQSASIVAQFTFFHVLASMQLFL
jgi:hypothetical protein